MARHELDREDLLAEATALVERVEILVAASWASVVVGFRRDGSPSVYFDADPVFQFHRSGELRRAFVKGRLLKADRGRLVALVRHRTDTATELLATDLDAAATADILAEASRRLDELRHVLANGSFALRGQVPADADVLGRVRRWLDDLPRPVTIATHCGLGRGSRS